MFIGVGEKYYINHCIKKANKNMGLEAEVGAMCFEDGGKATNHGMQVASRN